jgi:hypothetical protein
MKYKEKAEKQKTVKVKGQKRRVVEQTPRVYYSDEEIAQMEDYDYGFLLDMMYHKFERMVAFFNSKYTHIVGAKKVAKQIEVAMRLLNIVRGKGEFYEDEELERIVNTRNVKRYSPDGIYTLYSLRQDKAWHVFFLYLEHRMKNWWD